MIIIAAAAHGGEGAHGVVALVVVAVPKIVRVAAARGVGVQPYLKWVALAAAAEARGAAVLENRRAKIGAHKHA